MLQVITVAETTPRDAVAVTYSKVTESPTRYSYRSSMYPLAWSASEKAILLCAKTTRITTQLLEKFGWKYFANPPHSPYLASNDLHQYAL
jgi:hypothetical protein